MNSTATASTPVTTYGTLGLAALSTVFTAVLVLLKKDGILDRFSPLPKGPRKQSTRQVKHMCDELTHLRIQIQNLTPQASPEESSETQQQQQHHDRLHSTTGVWSDWRSDSVEGAPRMPLPEKRRAEAPTVSASLAKPDWDYRGHTDGPIEGRGRIHDHPDHQTHSIRTVSPGRPRVEPHAATGHAEPSRRKSLRSTGGSSPEATDCEPPSPREAKGLQAP